MEYEIVIDHAGQQERTNQRVELSDDDVSIYHLKTILRTSNIWDGEILSQYLEDRFYGYDLTLNDKKFKFMRLDHVLNEDGVPIENVTAIN